MPVVNAKQEANVWLSSKGQPLPSRFWSHSTEASGRWAFGCFFQTITSYWLYQCARANGNAQGSKDVVLRLLAPNFSERKFQGDCFRVSVLWRNFGQTVAAHCSWIWIKSFISWSSFIRKSCINLANKLQRKTCLLISSCTERQMLGDLAKWIFCSTFLNENSRFMKRNINRLCRVWLAERPDLLLQRTFSAICLGVRLHFKIPIFKSD